MTSPKVYQPHPFRADFRARDGKTLLGMAASLKGFRAKHPRKWRPKKGLSKGKASEGIGPILRRI